MSASTSTAIDLSRLPAPTVVEQLSYEEIFQAYIDALTAPDMLPEFDATVDSDPAVKVLQVAAYREFLIRQQFNDRIRQCMLAYATGSNLDQLGALLNVARLVLDPGDPANGIDPVYEENDAYRERIQLAPESFSVAGPETAYVFHARSADATIRDASATSPAPGEVLVTLLSSVGNGTASADQIDAVEEVLAVVRGNTKRPLTDLVSVASAVIVPYQIRGQLTLFDGPDEGVVLAAAQASLNAWLAKAGKLGADATRAAITGRVMVEGVQNLNLIEPPADVIVDETRSAHCVGVNLTVVGRDA